MPKRLELDQLIAVVVALHPDQEFPERLERLGRQVPHVIVVDNGSSVADVHPAVERGRAQNLEWIQNPSNLGIARALNQGLQRAKDRGAEWALTLDQDSVPAPNMVDELRKAYERIAEPERIAVLAAVSVDSARGRPSRFLRKRNALFFRWTACTGAVLGDVTMAITSGSLHNLAAFAALGGFRDDFFIDYVDTEYCLRAQSRGYRIAVACTARLEHTLGNRRGASVAGTHLFPTFHSPERWYYMSRNRIPMIRMYALRFPHWFTYEVVASTYGMLRMLLFEDRRREKIKAILKGTVDGLRGRLGPGPLGAA